MDKSAISSRKDFRIADLCDHPGLLPQLATWHHQHWSDLGRITSLDQRQMKLSAHLISDGLPRTWVALVGEQLLGSVSLVTYATHSNSKQVWLANLFVSGQWRRSGVGSALIEHCSFTAERLKIDRMWLFTPNLKPFYENQGWRWQKRARVQGEWVDVLDYKLEHKS